MTQPALQLTQMTLAVTRMPEMVRFYDTLFETGLQPTEAFGTTLYRGTLAGLPLLLCPNEIAGVEAEQSRHQLALRVEDLAVVLGRLAEAGGSLETPLTEGVRQVTLRDPDGNTLEIHQA